MNPNLSSFVDELEKISQGSGDEFSSALLKMEGLLRERDNRGDFLYKVLPRAISGAGIGAGMGLGYVAGKKLAPHLWDRLGRAAPVVLTGASGLLSSTVAPYLADKIYGYEQREVEALKELVRSLKGERKVA